MGARARLFLLGFPHPAAEMIGDGAAQVDTADA
jgi:hypothetical protein